MATYVLAHHNNGGANSRQSTQHPTSSYLGLSSLKHPSSVTKNREVGEQTTGDAARGRNGWRQSTTSGIKYNEPTLEQPQQII